MKHFPYRGNGCQKFFKAARLKFHREGFQVLVLAQEHICDIGEVLNVYATLVRSGYEFEVGSSLSIVVSDFTTPLRRLRIPSSLGNFSIWQLKRELDMYLRVNSPAIRPIRPDW